MKLRRDLFRIHMLTAILLSFSAAAVIKLNLRESRELSFPHFEISHDDVGWPYVANRIVMPDYWDGQLLLAANNEPTIAPASWALDTLDEPFVPIRYRLRLTLWNRKLMSANVAIGLAILAAIAFVAETLLRRETLTRGTEG